MTQPRETVGHFLCLECRGAYTLRRPFPEDRPWMGVVEEHTTYPTCRMHREQVKADKHRNDGSRYWHEELAVPKPKP